MSEEMAESAWPDESHRWTSEQHRLMACHLLDGNQVGSMGESSEDPSDPPWRHYTADQEGGDSEGPQFDLGPFLAALTHAVLAASAHPLPSALSPSPDEQATP